MTPAQQIAAKAARGFKSLQCQECSRAVQRALKAAGEGGQVIELRAGTQRGWIISHSLPATADPISQNGRHIGVRVDDIVYDNLHPDGTPYDQWLQDFDAVGGIRVRSITDF